MAKHMAQQNFWLIKSEPDECSIDDFARAPTKPICWDGVRNYQARNFMRTMQVGDHVFLYHSSCKHIGIAGIVEVVRTAYPDPTQFDSSSDYFDPKADKTKPRWDAVDLVFVEKFPSILTMETLKNIQALQGNPLVQKGNRLSVIPFTNAEWLSVLAV